MLQIDVTGLQPLRDLLFRAAIELDDRRGLLDALGAVLEANIERRFATKTAPSGQPWAQLAPATLAMYDQADTVTRGRDAGTVKRRGTLLQRTGQMLDSLSYNVTDDAVTVGMSRATDGGKWALPLLHETGTEHMPARPIFLADWEAGTLGADDERDLVATIDQWLDDAFAER
jgi:phage gpG-like protein